MSDLVMDGRLVPGWHEGPQQRLLALFLGFCNSLDF